MTKAQVELLSSLENTAFAVANTLKTLGDEEELERKVADFGFTKSPTVQGVTDIRKQLDEAKSHYQDLAIGEYYLFKYPMYKFVTEKDIKGICEKYKLIIGEASDFIGEIPERNMQDIAAFRIEEEDVKLMYYYPSFVTSLESEDHMWEVYEEGERVYPYTGVKVIAQAEMFDQEGKRLVDGYKLEEIPRDPIVLYPVKGGYLIVTMWGEEAEIDEIQ